MDFSAHHQAMMARVDENLARIHTALHQLQQLLFTQPPSH